MASVLFRQCELCQFHAAFFEKSLIFFKNFEKIDKYVGFVYQPWRTRYGTEKNLFETRKIPAGCSGAPAGETLYPAGRNLLFLNGRYKRPAESLVYTGRLFWGIITIISGRRKPFFFRIPHMAFL